MLNYTTKCLVFHSQSRVPRPTTSHSADKTMWSCSVVGISVTTQHTLHASLLATLFLELSSSVSIGSALLQLGPYFLAKGTGVHMNLWAMQHDERYWQHAEAFKPERWIGDKIGGDRSGGLAYMPFGVGPRMCIGIKLACKPRVQTLHPPAVLSLSCCAVPSCTVLYCVTGVLNPSRLAVTCVQQSFESQ